jgi:hypothetical protein
LLALLFTQLLRDAALLAHLVLCTVAHPPADLVHLLYALRPVELRALPDAVPHLLLLYLLHAAPLAVKHFVQDGPAVRAGRLRKLC